MAIAQNTARRHVIPWLESEQAEAERLYNELTQRFISQANGLLQRVAREQAAGFRSLVEGPRCGAGFPHALTLLLP